MTTDAVRGRHLGGAGHRVGLEPARARRSRGSRTCSACPSPTPGTNSSQTPVEPRARIGCGDAVPVVEVADEPDGPGVRRPDGERGAAHGAHRRRGSRRTWAPRTVHSCSCRPSPMRCRSTSPRVGQEAVGVVLLGARRRRRRRRAGGSRRRPAVGSVGDQTPSCSWLQLHVDPSGSRRATAAGQRLAGRVTVSATVVRVRPEQRRAGGRCTPCRRRSSSARVDRRGAWGAQSGSSGAPCAVGEPVDGGRAGSAASWAVAGLVDHLVEGLVELERARAGRGPRAGRGRDRRRSRRGRPSRAAAAQRARAERPGCDCSPRSPPA